MVQTECEKAESVAKEAEALHKENKDMAQRAGGSSPERVLSDLQSEAVVLKTENEALSREEE